MTVMASLISGSFSCSARCFLPNSSSMNRYFLHTADAHKHSTQSECGVCLSGGHLPVRVVRLLADLLQQFIKVPVHL